MRWLSFTFLFALVWNPPALAGGPSVSTAEPERKPIAIITVEAGKHTRIDTPLCTVLDGIDSGHIILEEVKSAGRVPVNSQIEQGSPTKLWWILSGTTRPGEKRTFELSEGKALIDGTPSVRAQKRDGFLDVAVGDSNVLRYNDAVVPPPEGASERFARSGFIHPLWSSDGSVLTAIHPKDHVHHFGIWMPWTATEFEGRKVDFWNLAKGQGTVRFVEYLSTASGPVFGGFSARQEHVVLNPNANKVALDEVWNIKVYNVGGPQKGYWLWDFISTQRCASQSPLHQLKYRYGGLGFRATGDWRGDNCDYLTSEGKTRKDGHGTRARWCDMFGLTAGRFEGVAIMSHPGNFRHPEPMRLWPGDMDYIFFNFAPSQLGDWTMEPRKDYVFRYRFYVHHDRPDVADIDRLWYDFAEPPDVEVKLISKTRDKSDE